MTIQIIQTVAIIYLLFSALNGHHLTHYKSNLVDMCLFFVPLIISGIFIYGIWNKPEKPDCSQERAESAQEAMQVIWEEVERQCNGPFPLLIHDDVYKCRKLYKIGHK